MTAPVTEQPSPIPAREFPVDTGNFDPDDHDDDGFDQQPEAEAQLDLPGIEAPVPVAAPAITAFQIENVPLPAATRNREAKYPFADLQVGQSFFVPGKTVKDLASTVGTYNRKYMSENFDGSKERTRQFSSRNDTKDGVKGVRVGRVK